MIKTNLAVLMAERGLKIADVYEATGISKTTLMAISENTGKGIQYETIDKLCNFLNVSPKDFFVYAPYIFKFHSKQVKDKLLKNVFDSISITVNKAGNLKAYKLSVSIQTPEGENYPVTKDDADFIVEVAPAISEDTIEHWGDNRKEFYKIYDSLAVGLQSDINKRLYKIIIDNLARLNGKTLTALDGELVGTGELTHNVTVKSGMNVLINIFEGRFTRVTKIPLFAVNKQDVKK